MAATSRPRCGDDGAHRHHRRPDFVDRRIPRAMAFGMFAFVTLDDEYFAYGAMAGLISAVIAGLVCVLLGDRSTRVYAPRITTTFFLGLLLYSLLHRATTADAEPDVAATLLVFFAIILLGGLFQALFGLMRWGSLIKFAPHPVMAGFQNMAAMLLFLVQLGNVLGGRRTDLCGDVERAPDHDEGAPGPDRPRLPRSGRIGSAACARRVGACHRAAGRAVFRECRATRADRR
jgi:hypothetical protein